MGVRDPKANISRFQISRAEVGMDDVCIYEAGFCIPRAKIYKFVIVIFNLLYVD